MPDPRIKEVAKILVEYSNEVKMGDKVIIDAPYEAAPLVKEIYRLCIQKGAYPRVNMGVQGLTKVYYDHASKEQLEHFPELALQEAKYGDAFFSIGAPSNTRELTNIDPKKLALRSKITNPISEEVLKKRWVLFYYPNNAQAQEADMSLEEFEDFVYSATMQNWEKVSKEEDKLKSILDNGKEVKIIGKNTDIKFSIEGREAVKGDGKNNMPCGEVFIAPQEKSTQGEIEFSFPAIRAGREVDGIMLKFKEGKVVEASAKKGESYLKECLEIDTGAKYLGEFGIGFNPNIQKFVKNILFDEKILGSIHLALGRAYKEGGGINESALHWDMIKDLREEGKILIDGKVIQENGKFLI
ncbi:aminopeptidase [Candidatus Woesearchaeota archaeon]|nr:aminopeptidase [Candidatus Woesearchaeota archaeon]